MLRGNKYFGLFIVLAHTWLDVRFSKSNEHDTKYNNSTGENRFFLLEAYNFSASGNTDLNALFTTYQLIRFSVWKGKFVRITHKYE